MIITLTANPSSDTTVRLGEPLERGAVQRVLDVAAQPGGKGVNISRAAAAAGTRTLAVLPADPDSEYAAALRHAGIEHHAVPSGGAVRVNWTITEPDGTTTKLNSPGGTLAAGARAALEAALLEHAVPGCWVALAGSLPPGVPSGWYAELVVALHQRGARVAVDTSEAPLLTLLERLPAAAPDLLKPNSEELASFTGEDPAVLEKDPVAATAAARRLVEAGVGTVLATLGGSGAVLVDGDRAWHAIPPPTTVVSTVGAGDSALCGYLLAELDGDDPPRRLARAVAYGSAAASLPGTGVPTPHQTHPELVDVHPIDTSRRTR